jgi:Asp-tRNA(Asn)/Glu-tRNA(Gln) amidotransferase B subunit
MPAIVSTKFVSPSDKLKSYCSIGLEKNAVEYLRDNFEHSNLFDIIRKEISNLKPNLLFNVLSVSVFKNAKKIENQHCFVDILKLLADEQISKDSCVELLKLSIVDGNFDYKEFAKKNKMIYNNDREYIAQSINKVLHTEDQSQIKIAADPIKNVGKLIKIITLTYPIKSLLAIFVLSILVQADLVTTKKIISINKKYGIKRWQQRKRLTRKRPVTKWCLL